MILKLDYDRWTQAAIVRRHKTCKMMKIWGLKPIWIDSWRSASGKGWHVEMEFTEPVKRCKGYRMVALQAILGSDCRRELWNLSRLDHPTEGHHGENWNILWDSKGNKKRKLDVRLAKKLRRVWKWRKR